MRLPLLWLKDYIKIKIFPEKLAELLTFSGTEVEAIERTSGLDKVMVGEILAIKPHPNADKLQIAMVDVGNQELAIVCGAPNIKVGQKVPTALVGAVLPNGLEIKKTAIRGVKSSGMLCAEDELGLGKDHGGIMILDQKAKPGDKLAEWVSSGEPILDLSITPNRGDCLAILGLAREISALTGEKVKWPIIDFPKIVKEKINCPVKVNDKDLCPKYVVRVIKNVKIKESPGWLKDRLLAVGLRPINNVVDVTNFVMMEMGQPLHAFDADKVKKIVVRKAKAGERIKMIDNEERELTESMLVITDGYEPIAIAGVMGGAESEVADKTSNILLESAQFNPISIRKTSQQLGLRSEASLRFEKGIDWLITERASDRAAGLIAELGDGIVVEEQIVVVGKKFKPAAVKLPLSYLNNLLGAELAKNEVMEKLISLGFEIKDYGRNLLVTVPAWRPDVKIPADLVEEIGRLFDYNRLPPSYLIAELKPMALSQEKQAIRTIQDILAGAGFTETINYSFYGHPPAGGAECGGPENHLELANPINPDQRYLRLDLEPRIRENIEKNIREFDPIKFFEIGHTYQPNPPAGGDLPIEKKMLAVAWAGKKLKPESAINYLKGIARLIFQELNIDAEKIDISPVFNDNYGLLRLDIGELVNLAEPIKVYQPIPKFPAIIRDIAIEVEDRVLYGQIKKIVDKLDDLIARVEYLSTYSLANSKKSLAFRVIYQSAERTLKSEEADKIQEKIIKALNKKFQAKLR
ncbi:MAG: phenylalanine--tRNA ligase subunit beta [bacterium]